MEQKSLFGDSQAKDKEQVEREIKIKKELEITDLKIYEVSDYIGIIDFENDGKIDIFKTIFKGRQIFNRKTKKEKFVLDKFFFYKGLEAELNPIESEIDFKSEDELREFLEAEIQFNAFLRENNKKHIYWDCRRYMWKKEGKDFKQVIADIRKVPQNHLEQKIKELSAELKEYLKQKYGYAVTLRILKDEKGKSKEGVEENC